MGPFLRRELENDRDFSISMTKTLVIERPSQVPLKTVTNMTPKTEIASPTRSQLLTKQFSPSRSTAIKAFRSHEDLQFATNPENFKLACLKDQQVLYENEQILVKVKTILREDLNSDTPCLRITLTYTNKTDRELDEFSVTYKSAPGNFKHENVKS